MLLQAVESVIHNRAWEIGIAVAGGAIVGFQALLTYIFRQHEKYDRETRAVIDEHVKKCNETPNSMILSEIRRAAEEARHFKREFREQLAGIHTGMNSMGNKIVALETKIEERRNQRRSSDGQ